MINKNKLIKYFQTVFHCVIGKTTWVVLIKKIKLLPHIYKVNIDNVHFYVNLNMALLH